MSRIDEPRIGALGAGVRAVAAELATEVPAAATSTAVDRLRRRAILFEQLVAVAPVVGAADGVCSGVGDAARDLRSSLTRLGRHDPAEPSLAAAEASRAAQALRCSAERPALTLDHRAAAVA